MDAFGAVEPLEVVGAKQIGDAPDVVGGIDLEVCHTAFTGPDRQREAEAMAVEPRTSSGKRPHAAALDEDRGGQVTAVREVPDVHRPRHIARSRWAFTRSSRYHCSAFW